MTTRHLGLPDVVPLGALNEGAPMAVRARLLGTRIDTKAVMEDPEVLRLAQSAGRCFVFRYGAVVSFGGGETETERLDTALSAHVAEPVAIRETESAMLNLSGLNIGGDRIGADGRILLADLTEPRLELVAIVLARNVVLSRDEDLVSDAFDRIAPLVADLREHGRTRFPIRQAMRLVGDVLGARHRVMGTVQADERPDVLWDHPELDRLYARLEAEYELDDRAEVLERKFVALGDFAEVLLDIVRDKRAFRLELAIIAIIAFETMLALVGLIIHRGSL